MVEPEGDLSVTPATTRRIAGEYGFAEIDHEVEFFGTCAGCTT